MEGDRMASQNYGHRIGQNMRRRKEADTRIDADAAERSERVLNQAKAYTDERVAPFNERLLNLEIAELRRQANEAGAYDDSCVPRQRNS
jgi:hypothetical protein